LDHSVPGTIAVMAGQKVGRKRGLWRRGLTGAGLAALLFVTVGCGSSASRTVTLGASAPAGWNTHLIAEPNVDVYLDLPPDWTTGQRMSENSILEQLLERVGSPGTPGPNGVPLAGTMSLLPPVGLVIFTPHPHGPLLQAYRIRAAAIKRDGGLRYRQQITDTVVPGATQAVLINDHFRVRRTTSAGDPLETDSELLMRTRAGTQIEVIAETVTAVNEHGLSPTGVTESVRLKIVKSI
jgi:hypothetical protein